MDYNPRKSGIGSTLVRVSTEPSKVPMTKSSKDSPRGTTNPAKSPRVSATAVGRTTKGYVHSSSGDAAVKRSHDHDHIKSASKEPPRLSKDYVKLKDEDTGRKLLNKSLTTPQPKTRVDEGRNSLIEKVVRPQVTNEQMLQKLKDDRERDILNQSFRRTQVKGDSKAVLPRLKDDRERDILNQSLKRTQLTGVEGSKAVLPRLKDERERNILNQSLKRPQVTGLEGSKVRHEKPREVLKKSATRPQHVAGDSTKASTGPVIEKVTKKDTASTKVLPEVKNYDKNVSTKSVTKPRDSPVPMEEDVKKEKISNDRKRAAGVKIDDGKDVRVGSATKTTSNSTSTTGRNSSKESPRPIKVVTGSAIKTKQEKREKKVFSLPGQRYEPPEERDALRLFYGSLHRQIPTSDMANIWLMEHGLLEADEAQKVLSQKQNSKSSVLSKASPYQAPTPPRISNGSAGKSSKFKNDDFLMIKPVTKKLKV